MLAFSPLTVSYAGAAFSTPSRTTLPVAEAAPLRPDLAAPGDLWETLEPRPWDSDEISDQAGLKALAIKLNPVVGYWDPLNIGETSAENIAWFRHAEIKHGRIAMAGFIGYLSGVAGVHFPWNLQGPIGPFNADVPVVSFADIAAAGGPADQWDALSSPAKCQIIFAIGFLELWGEFSGALEADGQKHYVRGGKPGYFPALKGRIPHPVPFNFWDPFGFTRKMTAERKEQALLAEVNNGRWAMLGLMGLICSSKGLIVPGLDSLNFPKYSGEVMAPFAANNADLPFVAQMMQFEFLPNLQVWHP